MRRFGSVFLVILILNGTGLSRADDRFDILQWLESPIDLTGDGTVDAHDVYYLVAHYRQPVSAIPTATPTPDPLQENLPDIGEINEIDVQGETTELTLDFPTGREAYLVIVRNDSQDGQASEVAIEDPERSMSNAGLRIAKETSDERLQPAIPDVLTRTIESDVSPSRSMPLAVGEQRTFDIYGGGNVAATLRYLGTHAAIYVDDTVWMQSESPVDQELVNREGAFFDTVTYPVITSAFGMPGDVNGDGHIGVLLTPAITSQGGTGYFYAGDLFPRNELDPRYPTNTIDMVYIAPPNTPGTHVDDEDISTNIAHEFQHLINFYYHSLVYGGRDGRHDEERWLDEGLAHLAEDYVGGTLGGINPSNVKQFLDEVGKVGIFIDQYVPNTTQRGGAYLLCRYLVDRFGEGIIPKLVQTGTLGIANIEAASGQSFPVILKDWSRAVFLSGLGVTDDPVLNYQAFETLSADGERNWGAPSFIDLDLTTLNFYGSFYYEYLPQWAFGYTVLRGSKGGTMTLSLLHLSGAKPSADLIRLPDRFVFPNFIEVDYWKTVILDEPLNDVFVVGVPRVITGRSADGQPFDSLRIFYRRYGGYLSMDRFVTAEIDGDRFSLTLQFDDPSDAGQWKLGFLSNGATSSIMGFLQVVEP